MKDCSLVFKTGDSNEHAPIQIPAWFEAAV